MISKRWIRRNRHINPDLVKAVLEHAKWPSFIITRRHPITGIYLAIDLKQLKSKAYIEFLRKCGKEYVFLELLDSGYFKLQSIDANLVEAVKKLFEDDAINIDAEIKDDD